jgi:DNA-binding LacI/PurR family transcriptional regulator
VDLESFILQPAASQVASFLRDGIQRRIFATEIPGIHHLASELKVNHKTVTKVLEILEEEGVLVSQGRGKRRGIASAGPVMAPALVSIVARLVELGHRRVVMLSREMRRVPEPAEVETTFLECLGKHGISLGDYHLPQWHESCEGFQQWLESLFKLTPPTALILHEAHQVVAVLPFIARRGIRVPEDLSLVFVDCDHRLRGCRPTIAQIRLDVLEVAACVDQWVDDLSTGRADRRQIGIKWKFVEGGTIGPAPK